MSAKDIQSGRILNSIDSKLANSGISKKQIWLEVTERVFLEVAAARKTFDEARALGHLILLDDFGTGYSSLSYLQKYTVDILKIDKSFIDTIDTNSVTSSVTAHIIDIAKELNLKVVAEGVEKQTQLDYLENQNVAYVQGYFFSKPICAEDFKCFVKYQIK